jgi:hypothetical protein
VKYTTMRFSAPGIEIDGPDCVLESVATSEVVEDSGGRVDQARRSELVRRTRWKMEGFLEVEGCEGSSVQRSCMSLKEEQGKSVDGDDVS